MLTVAVNGHRSVVVWTVLLFVVLGAHARALDVDWGEYAVGFRTVERYDLSRSFGSSRDYFGDPLPGEPIRPSQICIWYPAERPENATPMVYGEYNFPYPEDERFMDVLSSLQDREVANLQRLLRGDQGRVLDLLSANVRAFRDIPAAAGSHPLLLYAPEFGYGPAENATLCEYLASHGYVVATVHSLGQASTRPEPGARDLSACVGDLRLALGILLEQGGVDPARLMVGGRGMGAEAAMIAAASDTRVSALVGFQGEVDPAVAKRARHAMPGFTAEGLRVPVLWVRFGNDSGASPILIQDLDYAPRVSFSPGVNTALELTSYIWLTGPSSPESAPGQETAGHWYAYVRGFCDAAAPGGDFVSWVNAGAQAGHEAQFLAAQDAPPTPDEFRHILEHRGAETAAELFDRFELAARQPPVASEAYLNAVGYRFLQMRRVEDAVRVLRMGARCYPESSNAWDSYGEACLAAGDTDEARRCYLKALEVLPSDNSNTEETKAYIHNHAREVLEQLGEQERP